MGIGSWRRRRGTRGRGGPRRPRAKRPRRQGEGTHHLLSQSPRGPPAGPRLLLRRPRLRTAPPPRHVAGMDETSRPVPQHAALAPGSRHCHCPCHPSCAAASVRSGRLSPQQAGPSSPRRCALPAAPASPHPPPQTPLPPAAASPSHGPHRPQPACPCPPSPHQCLRGADVASSPAVQTDAAGQRTEDKSLVPATEHVGSRV